MSSRSLTNGHQSEIELQAKLEATHHFSDQLQQFPANRDIVSRLEEDISKLALAALAASNKPSRGTIIADGGLEWHKSIDLFENTFVCHRSTVKGIEYAVIEHFASDTNEIWVRGRSPVDILKTFAQDQRRGLEVWTEDMTIQLRKFLVEKYPGQDLSRVADVFMRQFRYGNTPHNHRRDIAV
jgi:hypothetical protein